MPDRLVRSSPAFDGKFVKVRLDEVEASDGHVGTYEVVVTRGAAAVLCVQNGEIVFVRQYRHAAGETLLEIPAGVIDEGESPAETAARELVEEVGLRAKSLEHLTGYYASPGFTNHRVDIYLAQDVEEADAAPQPGEMIEIERRPLTSLRELLSSGEITDAKTLLALALLALRL